MVPRDQLAAAGKLINAEDPALLAFVVAVAFNSTSAAEAVVYGGNPSGPKAWRTEDGAQTYKDWQTATLKQAGVKFPSS